MNKEIKIIQKNNNVISENKINEESKNKTAERLINEFISTLTTYKKTSLIHEFVENLRGLSDDEFIPTNVDYLIEKLVYSFGDVIISDNEITNKILINKIKNKQDKISKAYESQPYFNEIFLEKAFAKYYKDYLSQFNFDTLASLKNLNDEDDKFLNKNSQVNFVENVNNIHQRVYRQVLDDSYIKSVPHLCIDCQNATPRKCSKFIYGNSLEDFNKYPYITKGYIEKVDNKTKSFIVEECENFKESKKEITESDLLKLKRAREVIYEVYFDAENIEEAQKKYEDLLNRGQLKKISKNRID